MGLPQRVAMLPCLDRIAGDLEPFSEPLLAYPVLAAKGP